MKKIIFTILSLPLVYMLLELFVFQNASDPIKFIYSGSGVSAIVVLFLTTCISLWFKKLTKHRRMVGLFAFFYALLHMINFLVLDMELDFVFAYEETIDKPFIYLGMISFFALVFMSITSTKKLFKKYNKQHKVIYLILLLTTIHFVMAQKSLSLLQYTYLVVIFILFLSKINKKYKFLPNFAKKQIY